MSAWLCLGCADDPQPCPICRRRAVNPESALGVVALVLCVVGVGLIVWALS